MPDWGLVFSIATTLVLVGIAWGTLRAQVGGVRTDTSEARRRADAAHKRITDTDAQSFNIRLQLHELKVRLEQLGEIKADMQRIEGRIEQFASNLAQTASAMQGQIGALAQDLAAHGMAERRRPQ